MFITFFSISKPDCFIILFHIDPLMTGSLSAVGNTIYGQRWSFSIGPYYVSGSG